MGWTAPDSISNFCGVWPTQIPNDSLPQGICCHKPCKPCCPRVPEGELQCSHNKHSLQLRGGSQRYTWALNLLLAFRSNNWALQIDLILWFHWNYRSGTGMLSKGAIFLGQTLGSINLIQLCLYLNKGFLEPFIGSLYRTYSTFWWFSYF